MLKSLQLVGFKSFADRTEFEFSAGLTAVVGPNGSGKSNVVDAVRWVMGEQSARSLRGGEMTDVIFNGSASRRSLGLAEVTLTFDNSRQVLATPLPDVQITRRVYRSGEGEYLINNQIARLKDIKDLFLGSGAGNDAYSIIEQGRVEVLLQASTKDRRAIFEEAAGISRFRARKTETMRKLERVDANVLRLRDIMDEVEKQLRSVRLQAAKAQRWKEHSERLKELRTRLGVQEYAGLAGRLEEATKALEELRRGLQEEIEQAEGQERILHEVEQRLASADEAIRAHESAQSSAQQQMAADGAVLQHESSLSAELEADFERTSIEVVELSRRSAAMTTGVESAVRDRDEVEAAAAEGQERLRVLDEALAETVALIESVQQQLSAHREEHFEQMRQAGQLQNDVISYRAELDNLTRARERLRHRSDQAAAGLASVEQRLTEMSGSEEELQQRLTRAREALTAARQERERLHREREETIRLASEIRAARSGVVSRIEVLESLERSHEGVDAAVREVFAQLEQSDPGPWRTVLGITADFLNVRRDYAPLIDLALGERTHHFIVRDPQQLREALAAREQPLSGRVSFFPLTPPASETLKGNRLLEMSDTVRMRMPSSEGLPDHPGVVAPAEQVVTCDAPQLEDLPRRLLERTLIVRDLETARELAANTSGFRFVTLQGELLEQDGTLTVGSLRGESGLLSRKSELRDLRDDVASLDARLSASEQSLSELTSRMDRGEREAAGIEQEVEVLAAQAADLRSRLAQQRERRDGLSEEVELSRSEMDALDREIDRIESAWTTAGVQAEEAAARVRTTQGLIAAAEDAMQRGERDRRERQDASMTARVALAQVGERLLGLRNRVDQLQEEAAQREWQRRQAAERLADLRQRLDESGRRMLDASASLAARTLERQSAEAALGELSAERERLRRQRQECSEQAHARRQAFQARRDAVHERDVEARGLGHHLETLTSRLREDYQIDLAEMHRLVLESETPPPPIDPDEAAREIEELKTKLSRLGSINMEALEELEELETRNDALKMQMDDLAAAKRSLEEIINRINTDSRRMFSETLAAIRTHFQELFRKLFAGGQADIVLEDENDILETGIEIVARPPGKDLRSISLMSGGEKTLTAVALLLAIFRSKPSPFCILDEVDAALDEANIGRLAAVLREFLGMSQFIMITHSKRTMAAADVLYGVTMQESGVSKRIAVRFEDWPDDEREPQKSAS